ncbi:MAG: ABC transporter permease [Spirochaetes bacterium]|nr:ABC transporter permease [Spirochaetota bacterium]
MNMVVRSLMRREGVLFIIIAVVGITVGIANPSFLSAANISDLFVKSAPFMIMVCGMTLVIVTREIDISVGSLMGFCAALLGIFTSLSRLHLPVAAGVALTLLAGTLIGALNGILVTRGRVPSIIVTLGMLTVLRGITIFVMGGEWIGELPPELRTFGTGSFLGVPFSVLTALAVVACFIFFTRRVIPGRWVYAVGSNPDAARLVGLPVSAVKVLAFTVTGFLTALAAVVSVPQLSVIETDVGNGAELFVITCAVVGGVKVAGGRGSIVGAALGVLLMSMIGSVLIFLRLGEMTVYWEKAIQGACILAAVLFDHIAERRRKGA